MPFNLYISPFSKWFDRHQTLQKNKMPPPWTLRKYRQISFFLEAGHNIDIDPEKYSSNKDYAKEIDDQLRGGVVYKDKKKKYWIDEKEQDCFAIYAKALTITNSDDPTYWEWKLDSDVIKTAMEKSDGGVETAREKSDGVDTAREKSDGVKTAIVKKTKWLEVRGSFWTTNLSADVKYEVSFRTRMEEGLQRPDMKGKEVNLRLITPDGKNIEGRGTLPGEKSGEDLWHKLKVGQFHTTAENVGKMEIVMEASFNSWRAGLVIKGVEIKPV